MRSWRNRGSCQGQRRYEGPGHQGPCEPGARLPQPCTCGLAPVKPLEQGLCRQEPPALRGRGAITGN